MLGAVLGSVGPGLPYPARPGPLTAPTRPAAPSALSSLARGASAAERADRLRPSPPPWRRRTPPVTALGPPLWRRFRRLPRATLEVTRGECAGVRGRGGLDKGRGVAEQGGGAYRHLRGGAGG